MPLFTNFGISILKNINKKNNFIRIFKREKGNIYRKREPPEIIERIPTNDYSTGKDITLVYSWGSAKYGALAERHYLRPKKGGRTINAQSRPNRIEFFEQKKLKVKDIACGHGFTLFVAENRSGEHRAYGTGYNYDFQFGHYEPRSGHPLKMLIQPVPVPLPLQSASTKVKKVACGRAHSLILTDKEGVFSLGNNSLGQCGQPIVEGEVSTGMARRVKGLDNIKEIVCGLDHSIFLTQEGRLLSCGWGADGQTGLGHYNNTGIPEPVIGDSIEKETIVQVATSADCVLALSDHGEVFGWGNSEYGQLGEGAGQQNCVPRRLNFPSVGGRVTQVAVGGSFCYLLTDEGKVYSWGFGGVGMGPDNLSVARPTLMPPPLFGRNQFNPGVSVAKVYATTTHSAAVNSLGDLYMWGKNTDGCLGQRKKIPFIFFPLRVNISRGNVRKVALGIDHTAVISK